MTKEEAITALGDRNNLLWGMSKEEQKYYSEALNMGISALKGGWIPTKEQLPEMGQYVLCACQAKIYAALKLTPYGWYQDANHNYMPSFVLAWQPLPEAYKKGGE